jgi:hypothetical protein
MRAMRCNALNLFFTGILLRTSEREMSSRYGGSLYAYDTRGLASRKFQAVVGVAIRSVAPTHRAGDGAVSGGGNKPDNSGGGDAAARPQPFSIVLSTLSGCAAVILGGRHVET